VLLRGNEVLLEYRPAGARCYAAQWDTPGGHIEAGETPQQAILRELAEELGLRPAQLDPTARFDDFDATSGQVFRHHVFSARVETTPAAREGQKLAWHPRAQIACLAQIGTAALRALAALEAA
jgi:8-oxo-dGTP diphosphatase